MQYFRQFLLIFLLKSDNFSKMRIAKFCRRWKHIKSTALGGTASFAANTMIYQLNYYQMEMLWLWGHWLWGQVLHCNIAGMLECKT
jgi:hypothetical protein